MSKNLKCDGAQSAQQMNFSRCADPDCCCRGTQFFINLYDGDNVCFAQAPLPAAEARRFAMQLLAASDEALVDKPLH